MRTTKVHNGFIPDTKRSLTTAASGVLHKRTFAVKDLIDVAGFATGGGNPDWLRQANIALQSAHCVDSLMRSGATFVGKTLTDELAFSLEGNNAHYGTPINPACPSRLPGGSSSGSASVVAQGQVDFALGTDTGGSVRVPAAFCGVFGYRPTHSAVATQGLIPFSPSYDTIGWFTQTIEVLDLVAQVLLPASTTPAIEQLIPVTDAFALADETIRQTLAPLVPQLTDLSGIHLFDGNEHIWFETYATLQGAEIWRTLGPAIQAKGIRFGEAIAPRFASCQAITDEAVQMAHTQRAQIIERLNDCIPESGALLIPTAPSIALPTNCTDAELQAFYVAALTLNAIAGHGGLPQITVPIAHWQGCPVGLSLIAKRGMDFALIHKAQSIVKTLRITSTAQSKEANHAL